MDGIRRLTITKGQVAAKFGISEPTFDKRRPALEEAGFPRKLPGSNLWSEPAVDFWFLHWDRAKPIDPTVGLVELAQVRDELEGEYAA